MEDLCGEYQQALPLCFNYEWIRKLGTVSASTPLLREHFYSSMYSNGSGGSGSCSSSSILGPWAETGSTSSSSSSLVSFKMMIPPVWSWWQTGWGSTLADLLQLFTVCLKYPCSKSTDQALFVYISLFTLCLCNSWGKKTELRVLQSLWPIIKQVIQHSKRLREKIWHKNTKYVELNCWEKCQFD